MEKREGKQQKAGFPRFKSMNRYRSITYPQSGFSIMRNGHLILSKIGTVRMFMHRKIYGEIKTLTTSRDNVGDWFASFTVQEDIARVVVLVDPRNTSKTCSRCGWINVNMNLSDRIFHCDICGLTMDRDLNAAINIHKRGMIEIGRAPPEYTPVEIGAIPARATPVGEAGSHIRKNGEDVTIP